MVGEGIDTLGGSLGERGEVRVVGDLEVVGVAEFARDRKSGRRHVHGVGGVRTGRYVAGYRNAIELLEEIEMKPGAPKLAVGD